MEYSLLHIASWLQTIDCTLIGNDTKRNEAEQDGTRKNGEFLNQESNCPTIIQREDST